MTSERFRAAALVLPGLDAGPAGMRIDSGGRLATVAGAASVRQALLLLLSTRPGERVNRAEYGCHLFRLAFESADETTAGLAVHYVTRAVETWERRVDILAVEAAVPADEPGVLEVRMRYRVRATQDEDEVAVAVPLEERRA